MGLACGHHGLRGGRSARWAPLLRSAVAWMQKELRGLDVASVLGPGGAVATRSGEGPGSRDTLAMMELTALVAVYLALGVVRPRWTTLFAASVPTVLAFAW